MFWSYALSILSFKKLVSFTQNKVYVNRARTLKKLGAHNNISDKSRGLYFINEFEDKIEMEYLGNKTF